MISFPKRTLLLGSSSPHKIVPQLEYPSRRRHHNPLSQTLGSLGIVIRTSGAIQANRIGASSHHAFLAVFSAMSFLTKLPKERYSKTALGQFRCDREFDLGTGKAMAWMSQLAYETDEPGKIREILAQWGMELLGVVSGTIKTALPIASTHGFIAGGRGAVIVAFAGTDPLVLANWVTDFNARISDDGIAEGYATAAAVVWDQVRSIIGNGTRGEVFAAGHSLGGALAALTAYRLDSEHVADICAVYTFGMPRSGNVSFASRYNEQLGSRTYRIVHGDDIVPTLAPSSLGFRSRYSAGRSP